MKQSFSVSERATSSTSTAFAGMNQARRRYRISERQIVMIVCYVRLITISAVLLGKDPAIHTRGARGHGHKCAHTAGAWRGMFPLM